MANSDTKVTNPFTWLKEDHKAVDELFEKLSDTTENALKTREELFTKLNDSLTRHAELEEAVLYPALEEIRKTHDITMEAFEEHHVAKLLLSELSNLDVDTEEWTAKLKVLQENIEHHVDEEESDMFKKAQSALTEEQQEALAKDMEAFLVNY
ncbi:hemerythrin domain-containing protein [bacterium]|nr:MAG: hemerythrin domain-containing protein [bacterium]